MRMILAAAFVLAFVLSLALTALVRRVAQRIGFVDRPGGRKQHAEPTPFGGGVAIVLASCVVILGAAAAAHALNQNPFQADLADLLWSVPQGLGEDVERAADRLPLVLYVLGGGLAIAFLGLLDDVHPLRPLVKLLCQIVIVTLIVISSGMRATAHVPGEVIPVAITALWVVLLTNSFNLLDNVDGLSGTVAFICGGALLVLALQTTQFFIAGFVLALMGAVLGFLFFNFPPASIFMGDTGSMFLGYMLATATVLTTFVTQDQSNPLFPLVVPLVLFAVPLYDTVSVAVIRLRGGKPLLIGDRNHFSHRLMRLGLSTRQMLLTVGLITLATALGATVAHGSSTWRVVAPAIQVACALAVIMLLEIASSKGRQAAQE